MWHQILIYHDDAATTLGDMVKDILGFSPFFEPFPSIPERLFEAHLRPRVHLVPRFPPNECTWKREIGS
jgi:hypothetical protein